jgi:hypothetical protein
VGTGAGGRDGSGLAPQEVLPFPPTPSASRAGRTMQESSYENRVQPRRLPADAPNILIVLIDDAGPGLPDTFGGEVRTDTLTKIHDEGIGFNRFHTTAMCSPTRASLMTGRNHHRIGNGQIAELANDWDGYAGEIPKSSALEYAELKPGGPLNITMKVDDDELASGTVPVSAPLLFTANDCLDIGACLGGRVSLDYWDRAPFPFTGTIKHVNVRYTS